MPPKRKRPSSQPPTEGSPKKAKVADNEVVEKCRICLLPMENEVKLPCGHSFCQECLQESVRVWIEPSLSTSRCPMCRKNVDIHSLLKSKCPKKRCGPKPC
ncbi:tripartite motif-containing protein 59-like [Drosophila madeirensis]|uniref:Tripartite motif-containing protein 59-like n=1 Tax=Drosophila madeirensis TaxID=30013 RepID=A0AAU9FJ57_DROMD